MNHICSKILILLLVVLWLPSCADSGYDNIPVIDEQYNNKILSQSEVKQRSVKSAQSLSEELNNDNIDRVAAQAVQKPIYEEVFVGDLCQEPAQKYRYEGKDYCITLTKDANQSCSDSSDCEVACVIDKPTDVKGKCYTHTPVIGCVIVRSLGEAVYMCQDS